jgi:hypothetical protein
VLNTNRSAAAGPTATDAEIALVSVPELKITVMFVATV